MAKTGQWSNHLDLVDLLEYHKNNTGKEEYGHAANAVRDLGDCVDKQKRAVVTHYSQEFDDLCWMDDDKLYEAFGLPLKNHQVGDQLEMISNCIRFVKNRCQGGGNWQSYADLKAERDELKKKLEAVVKERDQLQEATVAFRPYVKHAAIYPGILCEQARKVLEKYDEGGV